MGLGMPPPGAPHFNNDRNKEPLPKSFREIPGYLSRVVGKFFKRVFFITGKSSVVVNELCHSKSCGTVHKADFKLSVVLGARSENAKCQDKCEKKCD